jgi:hypothetical protein
MAVPHGRSTWSLEVMSERISRILVAIEALALLAPTSLFVLWAAIFLLGSGLGDGWLHAQIAPLAFFLVSVLSLACGWVLVVSFVARGSANLRREPLWVWVCAIAGAVLALASAAVVSTPIVGGIDSPLARFGGFGLLAFGAPALLPFAHVLLERLCRMTSNYRLERP